MLHAADPRPRVLLLLSLFFWCSALLAFRRVASDSYSFAFLTWNLILAAVPLWTSGAVAGTVRRGGPPWLVAAWAALWLAFLPNAPYLVTDFMHLRARPPIPLWFDVAMLLSYAGTGLFYGWVSVADVHGLIERHRGSRFAWGVVTLALMASGFGVYVGRFLRWNSWDALLHPIAAARMVAGQVMSAAEQPRVVAVTLVYGVGLVLGYAALRAMAATFAAASGAREPVAGPRSHRAAG